MVKKLSRSVRDLKPIILSLCSWCHGDGLECPGCGGTEGLHHTICRLEKKFSEGGLPTEDIVVDFWCECCPTLSALRIVQYKGHTIIGWELTGEKLDNGDEIKYMSPRVVDSE